MTLYRSMLGTIPPSSSATGWSTSGRTATPSGRRHEPLAAVAEDVDFSLLATVRRRFAIYWLAHLLPGGRAADRNPPGTLERQAARVLDLLNSE